MNLPKNGRIAIIDDQINQAAPIMQMLSKNQLPYTYFSGETSLLPEEMDNTNDIRILFLDINLMDNAEHPNVVLKGRLVPVLKRVISENNYPYVIIYWSRHEHHKKLLEDDIFEKDLSDRKPISYLSADKSSFFNFDGTPTPEFDIKVAELFNDVNNLLSQLPAYNSLLQWENIVHISSDRTLQDIFRAYHSHSNWSNNANYIITKLAKAYLEKHISEADSSEKIKSSFYTLNSVFKDFLEREVYSVLIDPKTNLDFDKTLVKTEVAAINRKLNFSDNHINSTEPGCILLYQEETRLKLEKLISFSKFKEEAKQEIKKSNKDISEKELEKKSTSAAFAKQKKLIDKIKEDLFSTAVVVTPACDFAQKNKITDRIIEGVLINSSHLNYIEDKSEAIYILPVSIEHNDVDYILVLDFRYFFTTNIDLEKTVIKLRVRQELLSEIQSRLARHINRQGILFLDER